MSRRRFAVLVAGLIGVSWMSQGATALLAETASSPREVINLNQGWKFIRQDASGAEATSFDDASWTSLNLPHTWNAQDGQDGPHGSDSADYHRGVGWYRRHLSLADHPELKGKSLFLRFDGACTVADVFVNGKPAGRHKGMFAAFCFDVTPLLDPAGDNVIAVKVDNSYNPDIPPLSADFTFFGGIYRSVNLLALDPLSISPLDDASPGVYVKQTHVSADHADVEITTKLRNAGGSSKSAAVKCEVLDAGGQVVATSSAESTVAANSAADSVQKISLDHPHLWNARKDPYLYQVRVSVSDGTSLTDRLDQPLGLRFFQADPEHGFFLNGRSYPLHGVNRHQDRLDKGWAIGPKEHKEDFDLIMEMGCTAIRLAHYQHAQEFYDLCDRGGLVVWAESCMVNQVTDSRAFDDTARQQLRELIKQNYNHPSILMWSLFNELNDRDTKNKADIPSQRKHQIEIVRILNDEAHQLDPTRPTTGATDRPNPPDYPLNTITDIVAFNRYPGWYSKKPSDWAAELDHLHEGLPGKAIGISEYGAGGSIHQHEYPVTQPKPVSPWHPEEWQCIVHEAAYGAMKQRPWLWGTFLWNMFDFAADPRHEGDTAGRNDKGMVTYDRKTKKDVFYFYKANWSDDPFAYITDRRFTPRPFADAPIKIYSNCESVELTLNGQSAGTRQDDGSHIFIWDHITLKTGPNTLQATGLRAGERYSDSCTIDYDPQAPIHRPATGP